MGTSFFLIAFSLGRRSAEPVAYPQCKPMGAAAGLLVAGIVRSSATVAPCCGGCGGRVGPQPDTGFAHRFYPLVQEGQTNGGQMWSLTQGATLTWTPALPAANYYSPGTSYVVAVSGTGSRGMLGSTAGSWTGGGSSGVECSVPSGQTGIYETTEATWTAPNCGSVTVGGSVAPSAGTMFTKTITLNHPNGTACTPGTPAPTAAPSAAAHAQPVYGVFMVAMAATFAALF